MHSILTGATPHHWFASVAFCLSAVFAVVASVIYGEVVHGYGMLRKDWPDFSPFGLARIAVSFIASALLYLGLRPPARAIEADATDKMQLIGAASAGALLIVVAGLVLIVPEELNNYVREMQPLGIFTEILLIGALFYLALALMRSRKAAWPTILKIGSPTVLLALMLFAVFLILMEETSWGQHWLGFSTPPAFEGNMQQETNLHNFYTYQFEAVYYTVAFACFVVLPWWWRNDMPGPLGALVAKIEPYVPPRGFALAGVPVAVLMFESWNIVPYQVWYFLAILICVDLARRFITPALRKAAGLQALILAVVLPIFVVFGHNMVDGYELSEIREAWIAALLLAYGAMLATRLREHGGPEPRPC